MIPPGFHSIQPIPFEFEHLYRAIRSEDGLPVVLRVVLSDEKDPTNLYREFDMTRGLDSHPILCPLDVVDFGAGSALVFRDMNMTSLAQTDVPLRQEFLISVLRDVARALQALHARGVVHRNVKPSNIIVDPGSYRAWLTNFSLAASLRDATPRHNEPVGSFHYIAPEQTGRTNHPVDGRSDLYSLGITAYELACGFPPFEGNEAELVYAHHAQAPPPLETHGRLSSSLEGLIMRLIQKSPEDRLQSARSLLHALDALSPASEIPSSKHSAQDADLANSTTPLPLLPQRPHTRSETWEKPLQGLDAATLMRASQTIASEILLDRVIAKMLRIVTEAAGSNVALMVLDTGHGLEIRGRQESSGEIFVPLPPEPLNPESGPEALIRNAMEAQEEPLILNYLCEGGSLEENSFLHKWGARSVLLMPIRRGQQTLGALVLGNTLNSSAFSSSRGEFLALLVAQFVISLENAQSFARLESLVRERTSELERARDAAESAAAVKSQFLAMVSHEIRTPLNAVVGMTTLLLNSALSDEQREFVRTIRMSSDTLLVLINDILDFTRVEASGLEFEAIPLGLKTVVEEAIALVRGNAETKDIKLGYQMNDDVPDYIVGDVTRIRQVLLNLLSNAVKFTNSGSVQVRISRSEDFSAAPDRLLLLFEVIDTGIGIPADRFDRLFQPFSQVDASTARNYGGTGLGLAISQRLVEAMGGTIGVQSTDGQGSRFWFTLDTESAGEGSDDAGFGRTRTGTFVFDQSIGSRFPLRILIAEDHPVNLRLLSHMLSRLGYRADAVGNGAEAVEALQRQDYDLVLLDVNMPVMDGIEAAKHIKRLGDSIHQPVLVAVTANASASDAERYRRAGMDLVLPKPIQAAELARMLQKAMRKGGSAPDLDPPVGEISQSSSRISLSFTDPSFTPVPENGQAESKSASASFRYPVFRSHTDPTKGVLDLDRLGALRELEEATGESLLCGLVNDYIRTSTQKVSQIDLAFRRSRLSELADSAHALKGSSLNLGVPHVAELATELEAQARKGELPDAGRIGVLASRLAQAHETLSRLPEWLPK